MKWTISSKIMVAIMVCSAALASIIGSIALYQGTSTIKGQSYENLKLTAEFYAKEFSKTTTQVESTIDSFISSVIATIDNDKLDNDYEYIDRYQEDVLVPLVKEFAENTEGIFGIYLDIDPKNTPKLKENESVYGAWFVDKNLNGQYIRQPMEVKGNFYSQNNKMKWYYEPIFKGKGVWSKPYIDIYTDIHIITYTRPVYLDGELLGVAGIDIIFEDIMDMISSVELFETGYACLLGDDFQFIVSPNDYSSLIDEEFIESKKLPKIYDIEYKNLINDMKENHSGIKEIGYGALKNIFSFAHMDNGYIVMVEVKAVEIFEQLNQLRAMMDVIIIIGVTLSAVVAFMLGQFITKPLDNFNKKLKRIVMNDFSKGLNDDIQATSLYNGETEQMIIDIQNFRESINKNINSIIEKNKVLNIKNEKITGILEKCIIINQTLETLNNAYIDENKKVNDINEKIKIQKELLEEIRLLKDELDKSIKEIENITNCYKLD